VFRTYHSPRFYSHNLDYFLVYEMWTSSLFNYVHPPISYSVLHPNSLPSTVCSENRNALYILPLRRETKLLSKHCSIMYEAFLLLLFHCDHSGNVTVMHDRMTFSCLTQSSYNELWQLLKRNKAVSNTGL
jgi:hypothetical protein